MVCLVPGFRAPDPNVKMRFDFLGVCVVGFRHCTKRTEPTFILSLGFLYSRSWVQVQNPTRVRMKYSSTSFHLCVCAIDLSTPSMSTGPYLVIHTLWCTSLIPAFTSSSRREELLCKMDQVCSLLFVTWSIPYPTDLDLVIGG